MSRFVDAMDWADLRRGLLTACLAAVVTGVGLLAPSARAAGSVVGPQEGAMQTQRSAATAAARQAWPGYLRQIPAQRLKDYGFETSQQLAEARVGAAWPVFMPVRTKAPLTRAAVERQLAGPPAMWLAPVSVGARPVALVTVELRPNGQAEAVGFGSAFRASRIAAGLKAAGYLAAAAPGESAGDVDGARLRLLAFYEPNREFALLAGSSPKAPWRWFSLEGTTEASAIELSDEAVRLALEEIGQTEPKAPGGAAPPGQ